ncbi:MAG: C10 family peptidase [Paludibacteraceae bacterium]|nr:C10 family peptidase [Paludibacteraceae bacterium]
MKKTFLLVLLVSLAVGLFAAERTVEDAAAIAAQFTNNQPSLRQAGVAPRTAATMKLAHKCMKINSTEPAYYVFNQGNDAGFIIVSGDDRTEDVLVYAEQGSFDPEKVNPNFRFWLNRLQEQVSAANDDNAVDKITPRKAVSAIGPLLKNDKGQEITWYQEAPYWNQCPMDLWYTSERCLTGCVATAMSQIMYKWRYPEKGTGSHTYTWECCKEYNEYTWECTKGRTQTLSKDFSTVTFDWANMLPSYYGKSATTAQKNAVATLMYCCGIAADMQYGGKTLGGSGAFTDVMGLGATTYFGYEADKFITTYTKKDYGESAFEPAEYGVTTSKFEQYFNADLEAGRPIIMGGEDDEAGGHEFVCDGRNTSGYFHINWGWEGDGNCYCKLSALTPQGEDYEDYDFSYNIDAMIGLRPAQQEVINVTDVTVAPTSATLKINGKQQLTATIAPANATDKAVTWKSDNTSVATVSESGLVKGVAQGTATITVTTHDGNKTATANITVTNETEESKDFTLVTSADELQSGDEMIIVGTYEGDSYAATSELTTTKSTGYLGRAEVTIVNNTIALPDDSPVAIFTLDKQSNTWTLTHANGDLGATAVKKLAWNDGTTTWTISIEDNLATIANTNSSYGRILMNQNSSRFCNYTSGTSASMLLPQIYARSSTPTALPEWKQETKIQKFILDGQLFIMRDNKLYNAQGQLLR